MYCGENFGPQRNKATGEIRGDQVVQFLMTDGYVLSCETGIQIEKQLRFDQARLTQGHIQETRKRRGEYFKLHQEGDVLQSRAVLHL